MSMDAENIVLNQHEIQGRIARAYENLRKAGSSKPTTGIVEARLTALEANWKKFDKNHETLMSEHRKTLSAHNYVTADFYSLTEETYLTQKAAFLDLLASLRTAVPEIYESATVRTRESTMRKSLPRIQLPRFSGKYEDWPAFRDLFHSMVDKDSSLENVERLHYLKTCLDGEASLLLRNLPTTAESYTRAWEILAEHYANTRLLVRSCFAAFTSLPRMKGESVNELRAIFHGMLSTLGSLECIGRPVTSCSDLFVHLIVELLDTRSRREWENAISGTTDPPALDILKGFLECRVRTLEALQPEKKEHSTSTKRDPKGTTPRAAHSLVASRKSKGNDSCSFCQKEHFLAFCEKFRGKTPTERRDFVNQHKLCSNCFGKHAVADCSSKKNCAACQERHHSSIHDVCATSAKAINAASTSLHTGQAETWTRGVLLATAQVHVNDRHDQRIQTRALVDPGSEVSLITEALAQQLRLPRSPATTVILGVGGKQTGRARGRVSLTISSLLEDFTMTISALILPRITKYSAQSGAPLKQWRHLEGLPLADPDLTTSGSISLLLGADAYASIIEDGVRKGGAGMPMAQRTSLGWLVSGVTNAQQGTTVESLQCSMDEELSNMVRQFWEQEEPVSSPLPLTAEEQACEDHFVRTHSRLPDGRYMVRLPFKGAPPDLAETRRIALRVLLSVERKVSRDPELRRMYSEFMKEYEELGHMHSAPPEDNHEDKHRCYLPHHGVLKSTGDSVKIRVVFNGSARLSSGESLNAHLLTGPNLLPALMDVLLRWRRHRLVVTADIQKMYRQISMHPCDRKHQRILWRGEDSNEIVEQVLSTVTYGLASAPFQAIRTLRQLAHDERCGFPLAASILEEDTYVDDILTGADSDTKAKKLVHELTELCHSGGFPLRKWATNEPSILEEVPPEHRQLTDVELWDENASHATLGVQWHPRDDTFGFKVRPVKDTSITKRAVLSHTARLFDPLGWLTPVIIKAKMLIQTAWLQHLEWDEPLPLYEQLEWQRLLQELPRIETIRIPRWLNTMKEVTRLEIHGFADASERAFAAVVYLKTGEDGGRSKVTLLLAKSKVAPVKRITLPRLELCAAALLAKVTAHVRDTLKLAAAQVHLWSDSEVALAWIRGHPARWSTYVANRVADIQRALPDAVWHHVRSRDNPADCASRGLHPSELIDFELWWQGPPWLPDDDLPGHASIRLTEGDIPEQRACSHTVAIRPEEPAILTRFSTLQRLLRVSAWCRRWPRASRARNSPAAGTALTSQELEETQWAWIKQRQAAWFSKEIKALEQGKPLPRRSTILRLSPFLDHNHVLRVGGRLRHATLSYDEKHPAILPRESWLTTLIINAHHRRTLHGGVQATLASLRQRFWITKGRSQVRQSIHRCVTCVRWRAATPQTLMSDLPPARVQTSRAFHNTGVDYAGPIALRTTQGRGHKARKGFLAIFVCMSTRAVHLEVVSDLTTEAFLAAFKRFTSRRGLCETLYSDRGTNFVSADSELRRLFRTAIQDNPQWANLLANEGVKWRFNPPSAPHMGGLWEAAVKSVKHHLRRVIGNSTLTFEEMTTLLTQIEACLNSRPLQALSDDPDDIAALIPGHFLIGTALLAVPEPSLSLSPTSHLSRWQHLQQMRDHFWARWTQEYLHTMHERAKWATIQRNVEPGDLCIIRGETTPPCQWPLARIVEAHPGDDGQVRVVTARTATTTLTRPVVKIIPLPLPSNQEQGTSS